MNNLLKLKNFYLLVIALSISILIGAIYIEYIVGAKPCVLCKYQRIPYLISIFICFFGYNNLNSNIWIYLLIFVFLISFVISGYHFGIENSIFPEFGGCSNSDTNIIVKEQLLKALEEIPQNCKDVNFRILGFSLATINVIISFFVIVISLILIKNEKN